MNRGCAITSRSATGRHSSLRPSRVQLSDPPGVFPPSTRHLSFDHATLKICQTFICRKKIPDHIFLRKVLHRGLYEQVRNDEITHLKGVRFMKTGKVALAAALVIVVALASTAAFAGPGGCCRGFGGGWGPGGQGPAKLSAEQQQKADALRLEFLKKTEPIRTEIRKKRLEMMELASKTEPDVAAMEAKREEIWKLKDQMRVDRRAMGKQFRALLTPDQIRNMGPSCGFGPGFGKGRGRGGWGPGSGRGPNCPGCPMGYGSL